MQSPWYTPKSTIAYHTKAMFLHLTFIPAKPKRQAIFAFKSLRSRLSSITTKFVSTGKRRLLFSMVALSRHRDPISGKHPKTDISHMS
ncbi:MAG: hypothetical protein GMKNLPBB_02921 [Myxococcota bacterium]|nr:hypothetical protein [Myxococcota bacterium]